MPDKSSYILMVLGAVLVGLGAGGGVVFLVLLLAGQIVLRGG